MSEQCAHPDWKCKTCDMETTYYSDMVEENRALKAENEIANGTCVVLAEQINKLTEQLRTAREVIELCASNGSPSAKRWLELNRDTT